MLLHHPLSLPSGLRVTANRHRAGSPPPGIEGCRALLQSQPNPPGTNPFFSEGYPRIGSLQSHCTYLPSFQMLRLKNGPFFGKRRMSQVFVVFKLTPGPVPATLAGCLAGGRSTISEQNMDPNEVGTCPEINRLPGKTSDRPRGWIGSSCQKHLRRAATRLAL